MGINALAKLYAKTDRELFPASQLADGLERADTLYWADFSVADAFGINAVKDTFERCFIDELGYKELTELACVANHKIWEWYDRGNAAKDSGDTKGYENADALARLYDKIWRTCNDKAAHLPEDESSFYYRVLD